DREVPLVRKPSGFDFDAQPSLDPKQLRELATGRSVANGDAVPLFGPPGVRKTDLAVGVGRKASAPELDRGSTSGSPTGASRAPDRRRARLPTARDRGGAPLLPARLAPPRVRQHPCDEQP